MEKGVKILIIGGAGFIGSNLVEKCMADKRVFLVRVIDDLSNGNYDNIKMYIGHPKFEFIRAVISDYATCLKAV